MTGTTNKKPTGRARLALVLRSVGTILQPFEVARVLGIDQREAARLLDRWRQQGWMVRLRRGLYASVPLEMLGSEKVLENPWVIVPFLFSPGYVGGWSAAMYWDLTEQIFRDVCVITSTHVKEKNQVVGGTRFVLKHVAESKIFGLKNYWDGKIRIQVSDPARTILDVLDDPPLGGGPRQISDLIVAFLRLHPTAVGQLIGYAERLGNGAVFKRLGFMAEKLGLDPEGLQGACRDRLSAGNAKLDPMTECPRLVSRWRLWVPEAWLERNDD